MISKVQIRNVRSFNCIYIILIPKRSRIALVTFIIVHRNIKYTMPMEVVLYRKDLLKDKTMERNSHTNKWECYKGENCINQSGYGQNFNPHVIVQIH